MELGLYYYNARYYVPGIGRFASADIIVPNPTNPQSFNRYSYVNNNPFRFVDPTGHYGRNVHEYLTRQLANTVGMNVVENANLSVDMGEAVTQFFAYVIANANQGTDTNLATSPVNTLSEIDGVTPSEYYHFQSRGEAEDRLRSAISVGNWNDFGVALHTFQDYFSHVGSGFSFPTGEAGIANLLDKCPECFSGDAYASNPNETATLPGHLNGQNISSGVWNQAEIPIFGKNANNPYSITDNYNPTNPRDLTMALATEYWLTMWYLSYYQLDPDSYYMEEYGVGHEEYYNSLFE
jgi:RHS repeat-associated protein